MRKEVEKAIKTEVTWKMKKPDCGTLLLPKAFWNQLKDIPITI
jgi:hypothetical protein